MRNHVEARDHDGLKRLAWIVLAVSFLAVLMLAQPSQAMAGPKCPNNSENLLPTGKTECRPVCVSPDTLSTPQPLKVLTAAISGSGTGTFSATAKNPYETAPYDSKGDPECAAPMDAFNWNVKMLCAQTAALHCVHWHTYLGAPQGIPIPATAVLTATPTAANFFTGWSSNCAPSQKIADSRIACAILMDAPKTATATFSNTAGDTTAPTKPTLTVEKLAIGTVKLSWSGATDETWLGGYEIYRNGSLYAAHPRADGELTSVTLSNQLCKTIYTWEIRAFDAVHETASDPVQIDMGTQCPKPPPPGTQLHIWPPKVTRQKNAFFHWGATWKAGQQATSTNSQCKLDKQTTWKKCFPGKTYKRLKPGKHVFRVRVGNKNGWDATPAIWRWTIKK